MKTHQLILLTTVLFITLFYGETMGLNFGILGIAYAVLTLFKTPERNRTQTFLILFVTTVLSSIAFAWYGDFVSFLAVFSSAFLLAFKSKNRDLKSIFVMIEQIILGEVVCATLIRAHYKKSGIEFFTKPSDTLQLGYMNWQAGHKIQPHVHRPVPRDVEFTHEVLFVKSGKVRVEFYDEACKFSCSTILNAGDVILLTQCGHGFEMLEDCEMIEVKQGPYAGEQDKERFASVPAGQIRIRG